MNSKIIKKRNKDAIQLRDIFEKYGEDVEIVVYVYGNDRITGAGRVFESKSYTIYDIVDDDSYKFEKVDFSIFDSMKTKQNKISRIHKSPLLKNNHSQNPEDI